MKKGILEFGKLFHLRRDFLFPVRVLSFCLVVSSLLLLLVVWNFWSSNKKLEKESVLVSSFQTQIGKIEYLDEVLTMSTFMAASSGELKWEERYRKYKPKLNEALKQLREMAVDYRENIDVVSRANDELVTLERQAFRAVGGGDLNAALTLLNSKIYQDFKSTYAKGLSGIRGDLNKYVDLQLERSRKRTYSVTALSVIVLILLVIVWSKVLAIIKRFLNERKLIEKEVHERKLLADNAEKAKSRFLAHMSHSVRTPLTAILGFSEVLVDPDLTEEGRKDAIETIRRNGDHLLSIVNEILDLSKIESGQLQLRKASFSLVEELRSVFALVKGKAEEKGLKFSFKSDGPIPVEINSSPARLHQVLLTLLNNAIKFTHKGSVRITIRLNYMEDVLRPKLEFIIIDTGVGMGFLEKKQLFVPFSHGYIVPDQKYGETGLGLVLSHRIARLLGGDLILVESQRKQGSTFKLVVDPGEVKDTVVLENSYFDDVKPVEKRQAKKEVSLKKANILLVEDDTDTRVLLNHFLTEAGAVVDMAVDGAEAVEKAMKSSYDLIFMDIELPKLDGPQATHFLRSHRYKGPIVALSAHTMPGERENCIKAGCDEFLSKPVDPYLLVKTVKRYQKNQPKKDTETAPQYFH